MSGRRNLEQCAAAAGSVAALLLCGWTSEAAAATSIVPRIDTAGAWTDNINLAPSGLEESGELADVEPGLSFIHDSAREYAELDYTLHALFFSGGDHEYLHSGNLLSTTQLVPDWFELDLAGQRTQGVADPAAPANVQYLFPTGNLANYTYGVVKPILKHAFRALQVQASYTRGISDNGLVAGNGALDYRSHEQGADFNASSVDKNARLTWDADYQRSRVDYDTPYTLRYLYEQANGELGLLTIPTLRLLARGGLETGPQDGLFDGGLGTSYWAAGFDWSTGPSNEFRFLAGHRYFGRTYEGLWRRQSRLLRLQVNYSEQPTTQDALAQQQLLAGPPTVTIPGTTAFTRLSPDVYLDKSLSGAATLTGRVTEIGLSLTAEKRIYYTIGTPNAVIILHRRGLVPADRATVVTTTAANEDSDKGATLYALRRMGPLTDFRLSAMVGKTSVRGQGEYNTERYSATLTRQLGRWSSVYLRADHIEQTGQIAEYKSNIVSLGFHVSFGMPPVRKGEATNQIGTTNYGSR